MHLRGHPGALDSAQTAVMNMIRDVKERNDDFFCSDDDGDFSRSEDDDDFSDSGNDDDFFYSEEYELMCQGVRPWDDDIGEVLAILGGDY